MGLAGNDENDWLERARAGDVEAFGALVLAHQQFVYNLAWRALGDEHEAQDAAQEAFLRVWQALPNFRGQAQFRTWLYRIVTNVCYGRLPRLRRQFAELGEMEVGEVADESQLEPSAQVEASEQQAFLWRQRQALPLALPGPVLLADPPGLADDD